MERKDFLRQGGPCFYFDTELFAPTTDSFALGWFAAPKRGERVCDLGSGTGLLGTLLLAREPSLTLFCVSRTLRQTRSRKRALPKTAGRSA
ncbi:MAG: hypothetical protein ACLS8S_06055 [Oscillospiraceae bacterium]